MINKNGQITVACPQKTPLAYVEQLMVKKNEWIQEKLKEIGERSDSVTEKSFGTGDEFYYLGETYKLEIINNTKVKKPAVSMESGVMALYLPEAADKEKIKLFLKNWYISEARQLLEDRIKKYSSFIGVFPERLTIREQKTRWGSCSSKGNINFNWKLVMSPLEVVDYVVVHELCHLREMNHSEKFWRLVEAVIPQYKVYRKWLKDNGVALSLDKSYSLRT